MTAPKHTHWGVYMISVLVGGVMLAGISSCASAVWRAIT